MAEDCVPINNFTSPCPSASRYTTSTPPSTSRTSSSECEVVNPFDDDLPDRLRHSVFSPSFGGGGPIEANSSSGNPATTSLLSPYTLATTINTIEIDERQVRRQSRMKPDHDLDNKSQTSIDRFFQEVPISPISTSSVISDFSPYVNQERNLDASDSDGDYDDDYAVENEAVSSEWRQDHTLENNKEDRQTQTALSFPMNVDLAQLLGDYLTQGYNDVEQREDSSYKHPSTSKLPSSSSPCRSRKSKSSKRHSFTKSRLRLDSEDEEAILDDNQETENADINNVLNRSRCSSMAEMEHSPICVSPIMPMASDYRGSSSNSGTSAVRLVSDWDGVLPSYEFKEGNERKSGATGSECGTNSSSKETRRLSLEANISAIEPCGNSETVNSDEFNLNPESQENHPENQGFNNNSSRDQPGHMVRFLSLSSISEEDVLNLQQRENNNNEILNSSPVRPGEDSENRTHSRLSANGAGGRSSARLESTRQISFDDAAMISTIPPINPNDTLTLTEDSGFAAGSNSNVQQFVPALSSTHIGSQNPVNAGSSHLATTDSGILQTTNNILSTSAGNQNALDTANSRNELNIPVHVDSTSQNLSSESSEGRIRTGYREPNLSSPVISSQSFQNFSFMNDETSRDQTVNTNPEKAALEQTSAGIRDQFVGFEIRGSPREMFAKNRRSPDQDLVDNSSQDDDLPDCTPKQKPKMSRVTETPDLSALAAKSAIVTGSFTRKSSFGKGLFKTESSTNDGSCSSKSTKTYEKPSYDLSNFGQKRSRDGDRESKENRKDLLSILSTSKSLSGKNEKVPLASGFVLNGQPLQDKTNDQTINQISPEPSGTLKDVMYEFWWDDRLKKLCHAPKL